MSWSPIWTTAVFSAAQGVILYGLFECWRNQDGKKICYQPRRSVRPHRTPGEPGSGPFSWIRAIGMVDDDQLHRAVGLDHYVCIRFMRFGVNLTAIPSVIGVLLMVLVYRDAGGNQTEFNQLTMANVPKEHERLWYSVAFMWLVVIWAMILWWFEWENFVPKRSEFLAEGDPDMNKEVAYAAMVENIPKDQRSSPALYGYFDNLFPGKVSYASLCMHSSELEATLGKKEDALKKIEHAVAQKHLDKPKDDKTKVGGVCCCGGEKVDTEPHYRGELQRFLSEAEKEHTRISQVASEGAGSSVASSTGFVAFTSIATKLAAVGVSLSGKRFEMDAYNAPAPDDVLWQNVTVPETAVATKKILANCLWTAGILLWSIPVIFVLAIADLDAISEKLTWIPWVPAKGSFLYGLISGLLPVVALAVLTALVPIVIRMAAIKFVRMKSEGDVDMYVFRWHFGFRVANLWLILIGGSLFDQLDTLIDSPSKIVELLGTSVPAKGEFFMGLLLVTLLGGLALDLSRVVTVIIGFVTGALSNEKGKSDRELREANAPPTLEWGTFYPPMLFFLWTVFVYASIAPILLPVAFLLFSWASLIYKNQALYVYVQKADSGGAAMYLLFSFGVAGLYVGEVVFFAFVGIKEGIGQATWALILIFVTMAWHYLINTKFVAISKIQSLQAAVAADNKMTKAAADEGPSSTVDQTFEGKAYVQSCLKKSDWDTKPEGYRDPVNAEKAKVAQPRREHAFERGGGGGGGIV